MTALATAPGTALAVPTDDPVILGIRQQAAAVLQEAEAMTVDSPERKEAAVALVGRVSRLHKDAEARRASLVKPHNDLVKRINDFVKGVLAPVRQADELLRGRLLAFTREEAQRAAAAAAAAERARLESAALLEEATKAEAEGKAGVAEGLLETAVARETSAQAEHAQATPPARHVVTRTGAATVTKRWTFKVLDLAQVPRAYLVLDEGAVREAIRRGEREIAGLEIYQDEVLAVRG